MKSHSIHPRHGTRSTGPLHCSFELKRFKHSLSLSLSETFSICAQGSSVLPAPNKAGQFIHIKGFTHSIKPSTAFELRTNGRGFCMFVCLFFFYNFAPPTQAQSTTRMRTACTPARGQGRSYRHVRAFRPPIWGAGRPPNRSCFSPRLPRGLTAWLSERSHRCRAHPSDA